MNKTSILGALFIILCAVALLLLASRQVALRHAPATYALQANDAPPVIAPPTRPDTANTVPAIERAHGTGRVSVLATLRDGSAASGVDLSLSIHDGDDRAPSTALFAGTTNEVGAFTFEGLPWGEFRLFAKAEGLSAYGDLKLHELRPEETVDLILKPSGTIEVEVQDIHQAPVEGARVRALSANFYHESTATALSDAAGIVQLIELPIGLYVLQIESSEYATMRTPPLAVGEPRFTVTLTRGGAIAGRIKTVSGGYPGANVKLKFEPEDWDDVQYDVVSDPQGRFLLERLPEGSVKIYGSDDVFALVPTVTFATVSANQVTQIDLTVTEGAKISGVVVDKKSGVPIKNVIVSVFDPDDDGIGWNSKPTNDAGQYEVTKFPPGKLSVRVTLVPPPYSIFALPEPIPIELAPGAAADNIDIAIDTGNMLCGVVLDDHGVPCAQATVALGRVHSNAADAYYYESANCDRDGKFCFPDVNFARIDAGVGNPLVSAITLTANSRGLRSDTLRISLDTNPDLDDIVLELKSRPSGVVAGTVVDELGKPALARVWLSPSEQSPRFDARSTVNDVDGKFLFLDIATGGYEISLAPEPGARKSRRIRGMSFSLRPDEHLTDLRLVLPTMSEITGRVTTEEGQPIRGIQVDAIATSDRTGDDISSDVTDSEGYFKLGNLSKDEQFEVMHSHSEAGARWSVDASPGDNLSIVLPQSTVEDEQPADETLWLYERETGRALKVPKEPDQ